MTKAARLIPGIGRFCRDRHGAAAVEFSLLAPVLALICVSTVDIGFALSERMAADSALRAGAAMAMSDAAASEVQKVIKETAAATFPTVVAVSTASKTCDRAQVLPSIATQLTICAERFCACPASKSTPLASCSTTCSGAQPLAFYALAARKQYSGIFLPQFGVQASLKVQVQ